jgi:phenylalanyl-tRNA synthetase alpha chain
VKETIAALVLQFEQEIARAVSSKEIEEIKVRYLGKKGLVSQQLLALRDVPANEKPLLGKLVNECKENIEQRILSCLTYAQNREEQERLAGEALDVTLPGRRAFLGSKHPLTAICDEILDIVVSMGFSIQLAPEIDSEYYNFDLLNIAEDHPARDMQDTFYLAPGVVLRTHTSNVQGRFMESMVPPLRIVSPGRCFRNESISARHHVFFHQIEGLYVDEQVSMQDLLFTLDDLLKKIFNKAIEVRFRPSYFPFVEPGIEADIACHFCAAKGCPVCKYTGWLEVLGAGMVHPQVFRNAGLDAEKYTGFAWGMGIERIAMLRYGIDDLRLFAENDLRFLSQFPAV